MDKKEKDKENVTRQERREEKLRKKKERMAKHGKGLAKVYTDSALKALKKVEDKGEKK